MSEEKKKKHTLMDIADALSPETARKKVGDKHQEAMIKYSLGKTAVSDYFEFKDEIVKYIKHHYKEAKKRDIEDHEAYALGLELMGNEGEKMFMLAKQGKLKTVIDTLGESIEEKEKKEYSLTTLHSMIDPHDFEQQKGLMKELVEKHKDYLPNVKIKSPEELAKNYNVHIMNLANELYQKKMQLEASKKKKDEDQDKYYEKAA